TLAATTHQPQMRQAHAATQASEGRIEQARSGYLPQVTATLGYQRSTGNFVPRPGAVPTSGATVSAPTFNTYNFFTAGITATQLIYDFGQTSEKWNAAEASTDAFKATERATQNQVRLTVRTAFFQARAQRALVKVAEDTLENQQKHLRQI